MANQAHICKRPPPIDANDFLAGSDEDAIWLVGKRFPTELDRLTRACSVRDSDVLLPSTSSPSWLLFAAQDDEVDRTLISVALFASHGSFFDFQVQLICHNYVDVRLIPILVCFHSRAYPQRKLFSLHHRQRVCMPPSHGPHLRPRQHPQGMFAHPLLLRDKYTPVSFRTTRTTLT